MLIKMCVIRQSEYNVNWLNFCVCAYSWHVNCKPSNYVHREDYFLWLRRTDWYYSFLLSISSAILLQKCQFSQHKCIQNRRKLHNLSNYVDVIIDHRVKIFFTHWAIFLLFEFDLCIFLSFPTNYLCNYVSYRENLHCNRKAW